MYFRSNLGNPDVSPTMIQSGTEEVMKHIFETLNPYKQIGSFSKKRPGKEGTLHPGKIDLQGGMRGNSTS